MFNCNGIESCFSVSAVGPNHVIPFVVLARWLSGQCRFKQASFFRPVVLPNEIQLLYTVSMITFKRVS